LVFALADHHVRRLLMNVPAVCRQSPVEQELDHVQLGVFGGEM
jgi:hypothetical protein